MGTPRYWVSFNPPPHPEQYTEVPFPDVDARPTLLSVYPWIYAERPRPARLLSKRLAPARAGGS